MEMTTPEMPERDGGHKFAAAPVDRVLGPKGIEVNSLHYASLELADLRLRLGSPRLKVRLDPDDLGFIHVLHPESNTYFKVPCIWPQYATGLSQPEHESFRRRLRAAHKALPSTKRAMRDEARHMLVAHQQLLTRLDKRAKRPSRPRKAAGPLERPRRVVPARSRNRAQE